MNIPTNIRLSCLFIALFFLANCNPIETKISQHTPSVSEPPSLGISVLENLPVAFELARQVLSDPILVNIRMNLPVKPNKDADILTKFHFEAFEMEGIYVVVSCDMNNCQMGEFSTDRTFLMLGREGIDTKTILVDSTDAYEISLNHLGFEVDQFDERILLLVNDERGDAVWVINFINAQGDDLQIRISPQTGEVIEVLQ